MTPQSNSREAKSVRTIAKILRQKEAIEVYSGYGKNREWLRRNWKRISRDHAGKVVIIIDEDIACSTEDADEARRCLRSHGAPVQAYVRYVPAENEALLL
jgi:hypothetical protein